MGFTRAAARSIILFAWVALPAALGACASAGDAGSSKRSEVTIVDAQPHGPHGPREHESSEGAEGAEGAADAPASDEAPITLAAVGDIMLGSTYPYTDGRDLPPADDDRPAGRMTPFQPLLRGVDLAFGNLEGAIVDAANTAARPKCDAKVKGCFAFRMPPALAPQLAHAGFDLLSLANNHVLDFGEEGRAATKATLDALGIVYSGQRGDIARLTVRGRRVSMIAMSNYDHSYDLNALADATAVIADEAARCDVLIVSFHGGAEGPDRMRVPHGAEHFLGRNRGDLRTFTRAAVDAGADVVLGHGPHVVRGIELYRERLIVYSLGNFATYRRFNLTGPNGVAFVLELALAGDGRFVSGRAHALVQPGLGGPEPDASGAALGYLRELSRDDFPEHGVDVTPDGRIFARGTAPSASSEPIVPDTMPTPTAMATTMPMPMPREGTAREVGAAPGAKHLAGVHPYLRALGLELYRRAQAAGLPFRFVFGYTPYVRRTRPGPGGMATWHQFGLAFDVIVAERKDIGDGRRHFAEDAATWQALGAIAESLGLVWGGAWRSSYDPFHFEWHPGDDSTISARDLQRLLAAAGPDGRDMAAVWALYPAPAAPSR